MHVEILREYCLSKKMATEDFPFDEDTLVFKIAGKMFALTSLSKPMSVNLKSDPEIALELRETYPAVTPGWHMNKKHWNTVQFDGSIPDNLIKQWIDHSYDCVVAGLSKKIQNELRSNHRIK